MFYCNCLSPIQSHYLYYCQHLPSLKQIKKNKYLQHIFPIISVYVDIQIPCWDDWYPINLCLYPEKKKILTYNILSLQTCFIIFDMEAFWIGYLIRYDRIWYLTNLSWGMYPTVVAKSESPVDGLSPRISGVSTKKPSHRQRCAQRSRAQPGRICNHGHKDWRLTSPPTG